MLIDRSGSMNETFAGKAPGGGDESKATASRRILKKFVDARRHDLVGVVAFSTAPMLVTPLSDHPNATKAAIDAIDRPGLDYTNIARGLSMALSMFRASEPDRARAIVLISDGAGVIDPRIQEDLRAEFKKSSVDLYWLFLRTEGSQGIAGPIDHDAESPQAQPEKHLDLFFKSLGIPYRAFEADGPEATEEALRQIDRLERRPMRYLEKLPRLETGNVFFAVALGAVVLLVMAKLSEAALERPGARP
jgi:mxaC protein